MSNDEVKKLLERIQRLESELKTKDQGLQGYQSQASKLNSQILNLINNVENEIEVVRKIYRLLVPTEIPNISGFDFSVKFEASLVSGGDYYDIFELQDKFNFGILLSSASGHSLSALFMSILLSMNTRSETRKTVSAEPLVESIIAELTGSAQNDSPSNKKDFADLFYAIVDRRRFQFSYVNLGQVPAFYLPYGQTQAQELTSTGPALTVGYTSPVQAKNITLNPRDKILMLSPGVVENTTSTLEAFGRDRLVKIVNQNFTKSTHDLRHALMFELKKFMGPDRELQRDVTVVVIEVQDRVIKLAR